MSNSAATNYQLGYKGFNNGIYAPAQCKEWLASIEGVKVGEDSGAADWNKGNDAAREDECRKMFPEMYA